MRAHATLFAAVIALGTIVAPGRAEVRYFEDATIRAVQFVDANVGWAVGDEGVIWHTVDGGQTWDPRESDVRGSLRSVCFMMPYGNEGWIAGREELASGRSMGVLLYTSNGGATWKRKLANSLPGLNAVRFTGNPRVGFLLGDGCDAFASGVFKTTDAGRSWEPVPGPRASTWFAGEFADDRNGVLCGAWSQLANVEQGVFSTDEADRLDARRTLHGLQLLPDRILAVGQGGLILSSVSRGKKWGDVDTKVLTPDLRANVDFHAVCSVGQRVWIVGRPGSVVLASDDQGVNWKWLKTGQTMPLHGLFFLDQQRGWAVGEAGTILYTKDGGQTWTVQRQGGKRAALLFVHARPEKLDVDTLAHYGADEGYLGVALRCTLPAAGSDWRQATAAERFAAGTRLAGGMIGETLWQFPVPQYLAAVEDKNAILSYWNDIHDGDADRHIVRQLVLALRLWRPSVVVGDAPHPRISGSALSSLMCEALQKALVQASDPSVFPEQIEQLGLQPWRVSRYYAGWDRKNAELVLNANKVSDRLERSYREFAAPAGRILADGPVSPWEHGYRLLGSAPDVADAKYHMLEGLGQAPGEARRRELPRIIIGEADMKRIRSLSNYVLLAEKHANPGQILAQLGPMLDSVSEEQGTAAVLNVAHTFARQGQWVLAREAFLLQVQKYPDLPQSAEAYRWLIRHAGSSEARRRHEVGQFMLQTNTDFGLKQPGNPQMIGDAANPGNLGMQPNAPLAQVNYAANLNEARQWYRGSVDLGARLSARGPMYALDPTLQFSIQSSRRQLGDVDGAADFFKRYLAIIPRGPWHDAASTELGLLNRGGAPDKPIASCRFAAQKPLLDGDFNDVCWQGQKPLLLQNAAGSTSKQYPTQAWLAFDQEFLYLALRCEHPAGMQVPPVKNRKRDADVDPFDRVSIMLDLDRDYATFFHLEIDQRGCVREDCCGDRSWNPRWFVAVKSTPAAWCIEAAIPLTEMTGDHIQPTTAWACNVVRCLPGRGVQAWSLPADVQPRPEGMGVLLFTEK